MIKRIVEFQQLTHKLGPQALTKLVRIDTFPYYSMNDMGPAHEFDFLSQYALLPSMRTITGFRFETGGNGSFQWRHNPGISAVTEIDIGRSMVDGEEHHQSCAWHQSPGKIQLFVRRTHGYQGGLPAT